MGKNQENLDNSQLPPICGLNIDIYQSIPKMLFTKICHLLEWHLHWIYDVNEIQILKICVLNHFFFCYHPFNSFFDSQLFHNQNTADKRAFYSMFVKILLHTVLSKGFSIYMFYTLKVLPTFFFFFPFWKEYIWNDLAS